MLKTRERQPVALDEGDLDAVFGGCSRQDGDDRAGSAGGGSHIVGELPDVIIVEDPEV